MTLQRWGGLLTGHAHADTLSFELSVGGRRVFSNRGLQSTVIRQKGCDKRGTAAHNTVVVDYQDSSEVWSGFRVARRAVPRVRRVEMDVKVKVVEASHNGYHRLEGKPTHHRTWSLSESSLEVRDVVDGNYTSARAFFYCHPDVEVEWVQAGSQDLKLTIGGEVIANLRAEGGNVSVEDATWHPEFGVTIENKVIVIEVSDE